MKHIEYEDSPMGQALKESERREIELERQLNRQGIYHREEPVTPITQRAPYVALHKKMEFWKKKACERTVIIDNLKKEIEDLKIKGKY